MEEEEQQVPTKNMSRARRRQIVECLKKKRANYYSWGDTKTDTQLGKLVHTVPNCSCWMCGNPRRHFKQITIQEQKQLELVETWVDWVESRYGKCVINT